jgi:hypothetical protein
VGKGVKFNRARPACRDRPLLSDKQIAKEFPMALDGITADLATETSLEFDLYSDLAVCSNRSGYNGESTGSFLL